LCIDTFAEIATTLNSLRRANVGQEKSKLPTTPGARKALPWGLLGRGWRSGRRPV
jgi:hypothetical protein